MFTRDGTNELEASVSGFSFWFGLYGGFFGREMFLIWSLKSL